jgi:hypothetical protein
MKLHLIAGIPLVFAGLVGCVATSPLSSSEPDEPKPTTSTLEDENNQYVADNRQLHINSHNTESGNPVVINPRVGRSVVRGGLNGLDSTVFIQSRYLQETSQSKAVKSGSSTFAMAKGCMFMQRYRIAINADFTGTLNLMKYRSHGMGAEWINVQFHAESTPYDRVVDYGASFFLVDGTSTLDDQVFTVMEADLFDCG